MIPAIQSLIGKTGSVFGLRGRHSPSAGDKRSCGMNGLNGLVEDPALPSIDTTCVTYSHCLSLGDRHEVANFKVYVVLLKMLVTRSPNSLVR